MHVTLIHLNKKDTKHKTFTEIKQARVLQAWLKEMKNFKIHCPYSSTFQQTSAFLTCKTYL